MSGVEDVYWCELCTLLTQHTVLPIYPNSVPRAVLPRQQLDN